MGCSFYRQNDQGRSCLSWQSGQKVKLPEMTEWPTVKLLLRAHIPKAKAPYVISRDLDQFFGGV